MAGMELTIEEVYPCRDRFQRWTGSIALLLFIGVTCTAIGIYSFHRPPPYPLTIRHLPWQLALFISWAAYTWLAALICCYILLFLPLTPVTVEASFCYYGFYFNMGLLWALVFLSLTVIRDHRYTIAALRINAVFLAGLLVFWWWLARKYRQVDLP